MKEEIFGPVLPVLEYDTLDEAVGIIRKNPNPLALYRFTGSRNVEKKILREVPAGGVVINDALIHVANYYLPFGGVGASGMGSYHGKYGFDSFSHLKPVIRRRFHVDILFRYPPFKVAVRFLRRIFG